MLSPSTCIAQKLNNFCMVAPGGKAEGGIPIFIGSVNMSTSIDENPGHIQVAMFSSIMQRGKEAVAFSCKIDISTGFNQCLSNPCVANHRRLIQGSVAIAADVIQVQALNLRLELFPCPDPDGRLPFPSLQQRQDTRRCGHRAPASGLKLNNICMAALRQAMAVVVVPYLQYLVANIMMHLHRK